MLHVLARSSFLVLLLAGCQAVAGIEDLPGPSSDTPAEDTFFDDASTHDARPTSPPPFTPPATSSDAAAPSTPPPPPSPPPPDTTMDASADGGMGSTSWGDGSHRHNRW